MEGGDRREGASAVAIVHRTTLHVPRPTRQGYTVRTHGAGAGAAQRAGLAGEGGRGDLEEAATGEADGTDGGAGPGRDEGLQAHDGVSGVGGEDVLAHLRGKGG